MSATGRAAPPPEKRRLIDAFALRSVFWNSGLPSSASCERRMVDALLIALPSE